MYWGAWMLSRGVKENQDHLYVLFKTISFDATRHFLLDWKYILSLYDRVLRGLQVYQGSRDLQDSQGSLDHLA